MIYMLVCMRSLRERRRWIKFLYRRDGWSVLEREEAGRREKGGRYGEGEGRAINLRRENLLEGKCTLFISNYL